MSASATATGVCTAGWTTGKCAIERIAEQHKLKNQQWQREADTIRFALSDGIGLLIRPAVDVLWTPTLYDVFDE
jgi:hypothetical protein